VRILMRLRKESANLPVAPAGQDDGARMENIDEVLDSDIMPDNPQGEETVQNIKMKERCGDVYENKGSAFSRPRRSGNVIENKGSYAQNAGMLLKTKSVTGNAELPASSISPGEYHGGAVGAERR